MNWHERIDAAEARGKFNAQDIFLATGWGTCAIGEQIGIERRVSTHPLVNGEPIDKDLFGLGCVFSASVQAHDFDEARSILRRIEARAAEVGA